MVVSISSRCLATVVAAAFRWLERKLPDLLAPEDVRVGFERLCNSVEDLAMDVPNTIAAVGAFMVEAVADDVLPPIFFVRRDGAALDHIRRMIRRECCSVRM